MRTISESIKRELTKNKLYNAIYKVTKPYTSKRYRDDGWQGVKDIKKAIENIEDGVKVVINNGEYKITPSDRQMGENTIGSSKRYDVEITYNDIVLNGNLTCMACGSVQQKWDEYDMSLIVSK